MRAVVAVPKLDSGDGRPIGVRKKARHVGGLEDLHALIGEHAPADAGLEELAPARQQ